MSGFAQNLADRDIIHKPIETGISLSLKQAKPYYRQMPKLGHISKTMNTRITCTVCRGARKAYVKTAIGRLELIRCPACLGKGEIWNKKYDDPGELIVRD